MKPMWSIVLVLVAGAWGRAEDFGVSPAFFTNIGYRVMSSEAVTPTEWERQQFHLNQKSVTSIKSVAQVPLKDTHGKTNWYYRFTLIVEQYADAEQAKVRLPRIDVPPPRDHHAEPDKAFPLRKAFQRGNRVYIITTDVAKYYFDGPLDKMKDAIEQHVTGKTPPASAGNNPKVAPEK